MAAEEAIVSRRSDLLWGVLTFVGFAIYCVGSHAGRIPVDLGMKSAAELEGADLKT